MHTSCVGNVDIIDLQPNRKGTDCSCGVIIGRVVLTLPLGNSHSVRCI
jgi:hypothetical protein